AFIWSWPLLIRFGLSRGAFDAEVASIQTELAKLPPATQPQKVLHARGARRIGWYAVEGIAVEVDEGERRFYFRTNLGFVQSSGFMFCEESPKEHARFGILRPPWYAYSRD